MKHLDTRFDPIFEIEFTREEVDLLKRCAHAHYDATCKAAGECGGVIYGLSNGLDFGCEGGQDLRWREVDLLCKILEVAGFMGGKPTATAAKLLTDLRRVLTSYPGAKLATPEEFGKEQDDARNERKS